MSLLDAAARLGSVLEDDDLLAAILAHDIGRHAGAVDGRATDGRLVAVGHEQDARELDRLARLRVEPIDGQLGAQLDAILLAAALDDCVHGIPLSDRLLEARGKTGEVGSAGANGDGTARPPIASTRRGR